MKAEVSGLQLARHNVRAAVQGQPGAALCVTNNSVMLCAIFAFSSSQCAFNAILQGLHVMASSWPATAYMLQRKDSPALLRAPLVHDIARKLGKKPSQVLLNWAVAHGTTVSPKAGSLEHVQVNERLLPCILLLCNAADHPVK